MRKRVEGAQVIGNWDEANDALRQIGENDRDITAAETVMNEQIANAKAAAEAKCATLREHSSMLARALKEFATRHRADMGKLKSKQLTFGTISFRLSSKVILPGGEAELQAIIDNLLAGGMNDCVVIQPPKIDKNALKRYDEDLIQMVGASLKTSETFGYEVDAEKIAKI